MFLLVEAPTVVPVEAAWVVMAVAVPIVRLRVPAPAPVMHGEYREDQMSGYGVNIWRHGNRRQSLDTTMSETNCSVDIRTCRLYRTQTSLAWN